jgi:hypothetical protein
MVSVASALLSGGGFPGVPILTGDPEQSFML